MIKRISSFVLTMVIIISGFQAAHAAVQGEFDGSSGTIRSTKTYTVQQQTSLVQAAKHPAAISPQGSASTTRTVYAYTDPCTSTEASVSCNVTPCTAANGKPGVMKQVLYRQVQGPEQPKNAGAHIEWSQSSQIQGWQRGKTSCFATTESGEIDAPADEVLEELTYTFTLEDLQNLDITPAQLNLPNIQGHTLKNAHTNIWAQAQEQVFEIELNGAPTVVKARPVLYIFDYGDGQKLETTNPGYALHANDGWDVETPTSHIYQETGEYPVSVRTFYAGSFSVNGGVELPVEGYAEVVSEAKTVRVWRVRAGNVADTCAENPQSWGCPGV